jgi:hypothetical protein
MTEHNDEEDMLVATVRDARRDLTRIRIPGSDVEVCCIFA